MYSVQIVPPLYLLQTLVVFSEQENLVQTAERLGLTQPTVSRQLQQLEESFAQPLFRTQGRNKVLTQYGMAIVDELKGRFLDLERVFQKIELQFNSEEAFDLKVSGPEHLLNRYFSDITFSGNLHLTETGFENIETQAKEGLFDIGIIDHPIDSELYYSKKIESEQMVIAIPSKWAHDFKNTEQWAEVCQKHPLAVNNESIADVHSFNEHHKVKTSSAINFKSNNWKQVIGRISCGKNWGIVPSSHIPKDSKFKVFETDSLFKKNRIFMMYRKDLTKFPWMKEIIDSIVS